jgi:hypothetical protein
MPPAEPVKVETEPVKAETEPVKVEVVGIPPTSRDTGWWFTTIGPVVVGVLALVVAIVTVLDQHQAEQKTQTAANRSLASLVSFTPASGRDQFDITNGADAQINSVLVQPAAAHRSLDRLGIIPRCTEISVTLPSASTPVMYFRDANGLGWELPVNGVAEPSAGLFAILAILPSGALSSRPAEGPPQTLNGC